MLGAFLTHSVARRMNKAPFFFSRFNFQRMKERGNTHYCFICGGQYGFKPGPNGEVLDSKDDKGKYDAMDRHDASHDIAVIGNAGKYLTVWDFLEKEIPKKGVEFPFVVNVPSV